MYSVLETLIIRPSSFAAFAVLVSWACAWGKEDSNRAVSSAKSKSFNTLAGYRPERRGCVTTPESRSAVGVSWGEQDVNLLRNALWPPSLVERTADKSVVLCWGQSHVGVIRGQPEVNLLWKILWPPNLVWKKP